MLLYKFIAEFNIELNELDYIEIGLWILSIIIMFIIGLKFLIDVKNKVLGGIFIYVGLFFFWFIAARICRLISKFIVGYEYGFFQFGGLLLILAIIYTITSYAGLFFIAYFFERTTIKKTHFMFSVMVIVAIILSIINYFNPDVMIILTPIYIFVLLGIPLVFINLAIKASGEVRKKSLIVALGVILFVVGIAFDVPEAAAIWIEVPGMQDFTKFAAPCLQIGGVLLLNYGFPREVIK